MPGLAFIIGGKGKPSYGKEPMEGESEPKPEGGGGGMDEAKMSAAKAAMNAVKSGDVEDLNRALTAHYEACAASKTEE